MVSSPWASIFRHQVLGELFESFCSMRCYRDQVKHCGQYYLVATWKVIGIVPVGEC